MQTNISQIITLVSWGNSYLQKGTDLSKAEFFPGNPAFAACREVSFVDLDLVGDDYEEQDYAADPLAWLAKLKSEKYNKLQLRYESAAQQGLSDRETVSQPGAGGRWLIEAINPICSDFWESSWDEGEANETAPKGWTVAYGRIAKFMPTQEFEAPSLDGLNFTLQAALTEIAEFAKDHKHNAFGTMFDSGIDALKADKPFFGDKNGLIVAEHFSLPALRILKCIESAWVFANANSWNHVKFESRKDSALHARLSDELFSIYIQGILCAVNNGFAAAK